ncbi:MAG: hypothetical protein DKT66_04375 [Candidatus Melainabacteria bacterium]|nr:MAG: hypothetical protein DKT66_04375 [Candidatus Melainabacteria bacterium]
MILPLDTFVSLLIEFIFPSAPVQLDLLTESEPLLVVELIVRPEFESVFTSNELLQPATATAIKTIELTQEIRFTTHLHFSDTARSIYQLEEW